MYKINGIPNFVKDYAEYFTDNQMEGQSLPNATTTNCTNVITLNSSMGSVEVVTVAVEGFTIAGGQTLTLTINECDSDGSSAVSLATMATVPAGTYAAGDELARFILPTDANGYFSASITASANQSGAGKIMIIPTYLPR